MLFQIQGYQPDTAVQNKRYNLHSNNTDFKNGTKEIYDTVSCSGSMPSSQIRFGSKERYPHTSEESPISEHISSSKKVFAIIRHGYRYPSTKDMVNFKHLFPTHDFLWKPENGSQLTKNGKKEQERLGRV